MKICKVFLLFASIILLHCSSPPSDNDAKSPRKGGTFRMMQTSEIETSDPMRILFSSEWLLASLLYEGLVGYRPNSLELQPLLAESWQRLDNGRRYRFTLRPDVYFIDDPCFPDGRGRPLTARDVLYTFQRLAANADSCPNWYMFGEKIVGLTDFSAGRASSITGIRVLDDRNIEFRLTRPYASFLQTLASPTAYIVASEAIDYYGDNFMHHPVGTGPFRLQRWTPFEKIELARNENYWQSVDGVRLPYLDAATIQFLPDVSLAFTEFLNGESDLFRADEQFSKSLTQTVYDPSQFHTYTSPIGLTVRFFGFSLDNHSAVAQSKELRRAVSLVLTREKLLPEASVFRSLPAASLVPTSFLGSSRFAGYENDRRRAVGVFQRLKTQFKDNPLEIATNVQASDVQAALSILEDAGLSARLENRASGYFQYILQNRPDMFRVAFIPNFPDPEEYYALFYSKSPKDINLTGYANPLYDQILEQSMIEADSTKRQELFIELENILREDMPAIIISHSSSVSYLAPAYVHGFELYHFLPDLRKVYLERGDAASK